MKHEGEPEPPYEYPEYGMYEAPSYYRRPLDYRPDPYGFEGYAPRDLTLPPRPPDAHSLPINLSSDASLDLSTERAAWQRRRPPEPPPPPLPPPPRHPLPGKKLILETYHTETRAASPRAPAPPPPPPDEFPREYLPKKMRAAEIMGGKLAARHAPPVDAPSTSAAPAAALARPEVAFLEDPKNVSSRSTSTAAALAREEQEAASGTRAAGAPPRGERGRARHRPRADSADCADCCALGAGGVICHEKHSELLTRERVISICNIDKHDLDDYLNEGNSQENEEELLHYFHRDAHAKTDANASASTATATATSTATAGTHDPSAVTFLETGPPDPHDEHSQGKNEKICQLRELLAKNLKNQSGTSFQNDAGSAGQPTVAESEQPSGPQGAPAAPIGRINSAYTNGTTVPIVNENGIGVLMTNTGTQLYNGNGHHNVPQSPTTRTQAYDFVPINDGCHSPRTFSSKSPLGFGRRAASPSKARRAARAAPGGSLQTSPVPHGAAASPFVSPRNTPVPRARACQRPIPEHTGRRRRNPLALGVDACQPFAMPNDQKFITKSSGAPGIRYCQPMSAPPSPNIISSHYKNQLFQCSAGTANGNHLPVSFQPSPLFRDAVQPHSADPLSHEVSQFFQESAASYRAEPDAFRSQSVPLKQAVHAGLLYKTPVGSVPPTPVPNEFCDFGSLTETCDISKAGLNSETLDKIYDAIDSSNDVLGSEAQTLLGTDDALTNGCELLPEQQILTDELNSLIPADDLLDRSQFNQTFTEESQTFTEESPAPGNVEDFLKRTNSLEFDLNELVSDKNKYYTSRSVPSTPLPSLNRAAPSLQLQQRRAFDGYLANGICSKSVPSTPQLVEEKNVFNYGNRDFLINGNSVECGSNTLHVVDSQGLASPLHEILREDILEPLTPATDLLADLDKIEPPYVDI